MAKRDDMKERTPLDEFMIRLAHGPATLSIPRHVHAPEDKVPSDKHLKRDTKRDTPVTLPGRLDAELTQAYRRFWTLPETEPLEVLQAAYLEIVRLETQGPPGVVWRTLREAAAAVHAETGRCPFCQIVGPLHLPAEQIELELSAKV
jgi:hypothetical protein